MNKKGFTLAEILGVVVIISLLSIIILPPVINKIRNNEEKSLEIQNELIYSATDEYVSDNKDQIRSQTNASIPIQTLIDEGKLTDTKSITGEDLKNKNVKITLQGGRIISHQITDNC